MTVNWSARLAPLGVPSVDGRTLAADGRWTLGEGPAPLFDLDGAIVGHLHTLIQTADALLGQGTVDNESVAARMASGELFPEIDLLPVDVARGFDLDPDAVENADGGFDPVFRGGRVAAVVAGTSPAFDGVSFTEKLPGSPWLQPWGGMGVAAPYSTSTDV